MVFEVVNRSTLRGILDYEFRDPCPRLLGLAMIQDKVETVGGRHLEWDSTNPRVCGIVCDEMDERV